MVLDRAQTLLYVANDLQMSCRLLMCGETFRSRAFLPLHRSRYSNPSRYHGASPDGLALSPDERTLYVTIAAPIPSP